MPATGGTGADRRPAVLGGGNVFQNFCVYLHEPGNICGIGGLFSYRLNFTWLLMNLAFIATLISLNMQSNKPFFNAPSEFDKSWTMDASHPSIVSGKTTDERHHSAHPIYTHDRGYAMCVGENEDMIADTQFAIKRFRSHWMSEYPITIAHCAELSLETIANLKETHDDALKLISSSKTTDDLLHFKDGKSIDQV